MAWTPWRKVADKLFWYVDHALRIPVCYELGLADPRDQAPPEVIEVGAAASEHAFLSALAEGRAALGERGRAALAAGKCLYCRSRGAPTLAEAEALCAARRAERAS